MRVKAGRPECFCATRFFRMRRSLLIKTSHFPAPATAFSTSRAVAGDWSAEAVFKERASLCRVLCDLSLSLFLGLWSAMEIDSGNRNLGFTYFFHSNSILLFHFSFQCSRFFSIILLPMSLPISFLFYLSSFTLSLSVFHCLSPCLPLLLCEADYCCQQGNKPTLEKQAQRRFQTLPTLYY